MPTDRELAHALGMPVGSYTKVTSMEAEGGVFEARDFGAWCDGSHDDTDACLRARDAAEKTGGRLLLRKHRLTRPLVLAPRGTGQGERNVYLSGEANGPSTLFWDPTPAFTTEACIKIGGGPANYYGGGISDLTIYSKNPYATGPVIHIQQAVRPTVSHVRIADHWGGPGIKIDTNFPQNITMYDVEVQQCGVGWDVSGIGQLSCFGCRVNDCVTRQIIIRSGGAVGWWGGMIQGGKDRDPVTGKPKPGTVAVEIGTTGIVSNVGFHGPLHLEVWSETIFKLGGGAGFVTYCDLHALNWHQAPGQTFCSASNGSRNINIRGIDCRDGRKLLRARNRCYGRVEDAWPDATMFDLDATCRFILDEDPRAEGFPPPPVTGAIWR